MIDHASEGAFVGRYSKGFRPAPAGLSLAVSSCYPLETDSACAAGHHAGLSLPRTRSFYAAANASWRDETLENQNRRPERHAATACCG